ncbi:MAG: hypothetical protein II297_02445, partial [Clostridia bacterium]|nr:hypothetical protein [Clostridia bacterium]
MKQFTCNYFFAETRGAFEKAPAPFEKGAGPPNFKRQKRRLNTAVFDEINAAAKRCPNNMVFSDKGLAKKSNGLNKSMGKRQANDATLHHLKRPANPVLSDLRMGMRGPCGRAPFFFLLFSPTFSHFLLSAKEEKEKMGKKTP